MEPRRASMSNLAGWPRTLANRFGRRRTNFGLSVALPAVWWSGQPVFIADDGASASPAQGVPVQVSCGELCA